MNSDEVIFVDHLIHLSINCLEIDVVVEDRFAVLQLQGDDLRKPLGSIKVQRLLSTQQVHGAEQTHKAQVVIAMEVAYEYVIDALGTNAKAFQL